MIGASDSAWSFALAVSGARAGTVVGGCSPAAEAAKLRTSVLSGGKGALGPFADHAGLKLGDASHLLEREPSSCAFDLWQVDEANLDTGANASTWVLPRNRRCRLSLRACLAA